MTTQEKTKEVLEMIKDGHGVIWACKKVGIAPSSFYTNKKKLENTSPVIETYNADKPKRKYTKPSVKPKTPNRLIALVGSPDEVIAALRSLT